MQLSDKIKLLPHQPGVYLMRDSTGLILYIGKAKDLAKRVGSYFSHTELPPRIRSLIHFLHRLDFICTSSEREALILEDRLIKKHQPRYNVVLRDDKTYPYLKLTLAEDFPRIIMTRQKKRDRSLYFGPYPHVSPVRAILRWMQQNFNVRPCKLDITDGIPLPERKYASCLYLHIGSCPAPCTGKIRAKEYARMIGEVKLFLKGSHADLIKRWEREMKHYSARLNYEKSAELRDRIKGLQRLYERVQIQNIREEDLVGRIEQGHAIIELKKELNLPHVPVEIEAFDISNLQGKEPVGSMVTFKNGAPHKAGYRLFHVKSVKGANDTAMLKEIAFRRYRRFKEDGKTLPGLILIDGGKPQLHAVQKIFKQLHLPETHLAAIAKKHEEIFVPGRSHPIILPADHPGLLLLRRIRDEAHRFAIRFHTKIRRKKQLLST